MNKAIVPIGFSDTSAAALRYGYHLADVTSYYLEAASVHEDHEGDESFVVVNTCIRARVTGSA